MQKFRPIAEVIKAPEVAAEDFRGQGNSFVAARNQSAFVAAARAKAAKPNMLQSVVRAWKAL